MTVLAKASSLLPAHPKAANDNARFCKVANDNSFLSLVVNNTNSNGSITGFAPAQASGLTTLAYNAAGRVATASSASATLTTNTYDATGMRVRKVAGATTSRFVRGLGAELLQEVTGSTRRNYIYANGVPVAQLNGTTLHYLHTDQRGAPVKATNSAKTVRWSTRYEPFGATVGLTNPGSLVMNLRLPGQYADSESGLYDNGFRTYNPATGRYLQSDPIGLAGGSNTYGYVSGNPFRWVDPSGLLDKNLMPWEPSASHPGTRQSTINHRNASESFDPPGYSIAGHGSPNYIENTIGKQLSPSDLANMINNDPNYKQGKGVVLYACSTGKGNNSLAEELSKLLGDTVIAPDDTLWTPWVRNPFTGDVLITGTPTIGPTENQNTGNWKRFSPDGTSSIIDNP